MFSKCASCIDSSTCEQSFIILDASKSVSGHMELGCCNRQIRTVLLVGTNTYYTAFDVISPYLATINSDVLWSLCCKFSVSIKISEAVCNVCGGLGYSVYSEVTETGQDLTGTIQRSLSKVLLTNLSINNVPRILVRQVCPQYQRRQEI